MGVKISSLQQRLAAIVLFLGGAIAQPALAVPVGEQGPQDCSPIQYLDRPLLPQVNPASDANFSKSVSHHTVGGPVLADDFIPVSSGRLHCIDWWGTQASSDHWELTLHLGNFGPAPLAQPAASGGFKLFATAIGNDSDLNGIYWYHVKIDDPDWTVIAGQHYWFSAANLNDGWKWSLADGLPEVGSQLFSAVQSTGTLPCPDSGPHCGAWVAQNEQYAFALQIPEPGSWALLGAALGAAGFARKRKAAIQPV
jgi:hypothetical protein